MTGRVVGSALAVAAVAAVLGCGVVNTSSGDADNEATDDDAIAACLDELSRAGIYGDGVSNHDAVATKPDPSFYARRHGDDWTVTGVVLARDRLYTGWYTHELVCPLTHDVDGWRLTAPITDNGTPRAN